MNTLEILSLAAGVTSVVVGVIAIWLSVDFYSRGKEAEKNVEVALSGIKAQTEALKEVNSVTLDRLTKYVTTPRKDSEEILKIALDKTHQMFSDSLRGLKPHQNQTEDQLRKELIAVYIAVWHYVAQTNVWAGFSLPKRDEFDKNRQLDVYAKTVVDRSYADFMTMNRLVGVITAEEVEASGLKFLHDEVKNGLDAMVKDTASRFAESASS